MLLLFLFAALLCIKQMLLGWKVATIGCRRAHCSAATARLPLLMLDATHQARHDVWQVVAIEAHIHHRTNDLQKIQPNIKGKGLNTKALPEHRESPGELQEQYWR
jgi:hypothetical protein